MEQRSKIIRVLSRVIFVVVVCLLVFAADHALIQWMSGICQQQENLVYAIAAGGEDSIEYAKYLKQEPSRKIVERGKKELAVLGYREEVSTIQNSRIVSFANQVYGWSIFALGIFFALVFFILHIYESVYKKQLHLISFVLSRLHEKEIPKENKTLHPRVGLLGAWEEEEILQENLESLKELNQLQNERMEMEKEGTKRLVTDISHQIKTPIAALQNSLEILKEEDLTEEERQEFLTRAIKQMESLSGLVKSMVNISRMEKGMIAIQKKSTDLIKTIRKSVSRVWEKAENKEISIEFENGEEICEYLLCHDPYWTVEALSNILDNAIKYSPFQSTIRIRLIFLTMYLKIEIEDEGIGVPKEEYHQIFQRFYRGQAVKDVEGSGVGLYLTREILERQDGSVIVRARRGGGSIFVVQLPLVS